MQSVTTIVYVPKEQIVVADSQESGSITSHCQKLYRAKGHVIGTSGDSYSGLAFIEWFKAGSDPDAIPNFTSLPEDQDFECMVIRPNRTVYTVNKLFVPYDRTRPRYVILGSGTACAAGALEQGATAREAVRIAAKLDDATGGRLQVMHV